MELAEFDTAPAIITPVAPAYPELAKKAGIEGEVLLKIGIREDGKVETVEVQKGSGKDIGFEEAAIAAAKKFEFKPALKNNRPAAVSVVLPFKFKLSRSRLKNCLENRPRLFIFWNNFLHNVRRLKALLRALFQMRTLAEDTSPEMEAVLIKLLRKRTPLSDKDEMELTAFARRQRVDIGAGEIWMASAEDLILAKLNWFRKGSEVSEKQWRDVLGVLKVQGERLDFVYLEPMAARFGLAALLKRAREEAGSV